MVDIFKEMEAENKRSVTEEDLGQLSALAKQQQDLERPISPQEEAKVETLFKTLLKRNFSSAMVNLLAKKMAEHYQRIRMVQIPDLMDEIGMKSFELSEGGKITIKPDISVNLKVADKPKLNQYLIKQGFEDLIKNQIIVQFAAGSRKLSKQLEEYLQKNYPDQEGCAVKTKEEVHGQTLKKFVKTQLEAGKKLPAFLAIYEYKYSKIT